MSFLNFGKSKIDRRQFLKTSGAATLATGASSVAASSLRGQGRRVKEDTRTLDEIYQAALDEGGKLIVYAGGDFDAQVDTTRAAFAERFPEMELEIYVDYSKFHGPRLETQFATNNLVADVVQLQTLHDFNRWAFQGRLMPYKPPGHSYIHPVFQDPWGFSTPATVLAFSYFVNTGLSGGVIPTVEQFTDAQWAGQIASTYPNDDDAALFLFKKYVDTFGFEWLEELAAQNIAFNRGSHVAGTLAQEGQATLGLGGAWSVFLNGLTPADWVLPSQDPFMAWGQRAAALAGAQNSEAAKLYLSWVLSPEEQLNSFTGWRVRTDLEPGPGLSHIWDYENAFVGEFPVFMENRESAEIWRQTFSLFFGDVQGEPTPGNLGIYPGA